MIRWFLKGLLVTLQEEPVQFALGLALAISGGVGFLMYQTAPADSPYSFGLPYEYIFPFMFICGVPLVIDAWVRAHNYYDDN